MNLVFFDDIKIRKCLLPFTYTRPVCDLRVGILTIREKWEKLLGVSSSSITEDYLQTKYRMNIEADNVIVNGALLPDQHLLEKIRNLKSGSVLSKGNTLIAAKVKREFFDGIKSARDLRFNKSEEYSGECELIKHTWDIFHKNGFSIKHDFELLTKGRKSQPLSESNQLIGQSTALFLEEGAKVEGVIINVTEGPVYVGRQAEVMEGSLIRGPFALGDQAVIKMGTKIYGPSTIGPACKAGGEINNSVMFANSNKAHDGFLGNSVIGEWCNLGADTNTSNLKNNYSTVKVWDYFTSGMSDSGLTFCGLMMGDHSKCAINTMFNTGTVVGVNANIFGFGFPSKFIPSFSWDGSNEQTTFSFEQAIEVATRVMERRNHKLTEADKQILKSVFEQSAQYRHWEKG